MRTSKLITILKALDPEETRQFYRYVRAPFFTKSEDALKLYKYIRKYYPKFDTPKLDRERVYDKLFPNCRYNGAKLRNLILKLTKILENYLIYVKCQQVSLEKKKLLNQIYGERNIYGLFEKSTNDLLQDLERQPFRDADFFYDTYSLQRDFYFHPNTPKQGDMVNTLKNSLHNLQEFHQIERLEAGLDLKNRERIYSEKHDFEVKHLLVESSETIISKLLKELIKLVETSADVSFFKAKKLFQQHICQIAPKDGATILTALLNHAIQQLPKDKLELKFTRETFELYKIGLDNKILIKNNTISNNTFLNICVIGAKLKEFDFVHKFILDYTLFLTKNTRNEITKLALGFVCYNQADYSKVIKVLESYQSSNFLYKINARTLLMRTYFQEYEKDSSYAGLVITKSESFIRFIKRLEKLNLEKQKTYLNFAKLLIKITKQKELLVNNDAAKVELLALLDGFSYIFVREWIREKINNL